MSTIKAKDSTFYATGRRKESVARVWITEGGNGIIVNEKPIDQFFGRETLIMIVNQPLELTETVGKFGISANVKGGGPTGQAGAIRLGIARALLQFNETLRSTLRRSGFLTRDPRGKERKKYGRKGARRSFQFTKR